MLSEKIVDNKYWNYLLHQVFRVLYADKHLSVAKEFSRKEQTNSLTMRINAFVLKMGKLRLFFLVCGSQFSQLSSTGTQILYSRTHPSLPPSEIFYLVLIGTSQSITKITTKLDSEFRSPWKIKTSLKQWESLENSEWLCVRRIWDRCHWKQHSRISLPSLPLW